MKLPWNQKERDLHIFNSYCKKILRQENVDMQRSEVRHRVRECSFSELPSELLAKLCCLDVHSVEFEVCGYHIPVNDDRLAAALAKLLREKHDVILLSYFMDMSDREIGELLDMARRTVQHQRTDVLAERRKQILLSHEAEVKIRKRPWMICVLIEIGIVIDRIAGFLLIPIGGNRLQKMAHYQLVLIGLYRCLYRTIHRSFSYTFFLCLRFFYLFGRILVSPCSHVFSADCIFTKPT